MVKLVSVRRTRLYGPAAWRDWWEYINAFVYLVATIVLLVGCILLLPGRSSAKLGLILVLVALALLVIVNLHDLIAQLAGFDFSLPLLSLDPQLALIEILAPLLQVLGSILFFIGTILLLEVGRGKYDEKQAENLTNHAFRLIIGGSGLWMFGSILNVSQVYERVDMRVQFMQKMVSIPFLMSSTLFLVSGILGAGNFPYPPAVIKVRATAVWIAITASSLLVLAAILNTKRVIELHQLAAAGGLLEPLRGGAQERLDLEREEEGTSRDRQKYAANVEEGSSYKAGVVMAE
ncbi:unnamed protein product [Sphagnum troendelagicum]|uniref:Uncharacterized protein n=1 Tax=Sphagnum troendelagicum TaxID=128251 RepID=A0ABP0T8M9_9BRYO